MSLLQRTVRGLSLLSVVVWQDDPLLDRLSALDNRLASKVLYTYRF